eukprot:scaffold31_cov132-Skeletonema_menzelii.AAC.2
MTYVISHMMDMSRTFIASSAHDLTGYYSASHARRESRRAVSCATKCDHLLNFSLAVLIALPFVRLRGFRAITYALVPSLLSSFYLSLLSGGIREVEEEEEEEEEASEIQDSFADIQAKYERAVTRFSRCLWAGSTTYSCSLFLEEVVRRIII